LSGANPQASYDIINGPLDCQASPLPAARRATYVSGNHISGVYDKLSSAPCLKFTSKLKLIADYC